MYGNLRKLSETCEKHVFPGSERVVLIVPGYVECSRRVCQIRRTGSMYTGNPTSAGQDILELVCVRDLSHIGTSYGRLVYLGGLRNPDTGKYEHYGATSSISGPTDLSRGLKRVHEQIFNEWISFPLERKKADIELYIESIPQVDRNELIDAWLRLRPYKNLVPASIQGPEREKHTSDFEAILGLLKNVYGVASPDPFA